MITMNNNDNRNYIEEDICDELVKSWGSPLVLRGNVGQFSGGLLHPRTLANLDSLGKGPEHRIKYGRKVAYKTDVLAKWIKEKIVTF